jgi:hypothetical protein
MKRVLLVGLDPATVDFSDPALPPGMTAEKIDAGVKAALADMAERGWQAENCFINPDETAAPVVERRLAEGRYDCVVNGADRRTQAPASSQAPTCPSPKPPPSRLTDFPTRLIGPRRRGSVRVGLSTSRGYRPAATVLQDSQRRGGLTAEGRDGWPRVRGCGPSRRCGTTRPGGGSGGAGRRLLEAPRSGPRWGTRWA